MSMDAPEAVKVEVPKSLLDKLGAALPVGLTALATAFAGMSTSELQRAMFWKSQAAQDQSQATNQWSYAGFKRDRALIMQTSAAQLRAASGYAPANLSPAMLPPIKVKPDDANAEDIRKEQEAAQTRALELLQKKSLDPVPLPEPLDPNIVVLQKAIKSRESESELLKLAGRIKLATITAAIDDAEKRSADYDALMSPIFKAAAEISGSESGATNTIRSARQAAGYDLEERRYRLESQLNQGIGYLYEIRVRVTSAESDKHRHKSELFFYAMLSAQVGATVAALALARKTKSLLWLLAGTTGVVALGIGAYVYLAP